MANRENLSLIESQEKDENNREYKQQDGQMILSELRVDKAFDCDWTE